MVKKLLCIGLFALAAIKSAVAEVEIWDLSQAHDVAILIKSSIPLNVILDKGLEKDFSFENHQIEIRLPGGRIIRQDVVLGMIDSTGGQLTRMSTTGGPMPFDQAIQIGTLFHKAFGIQTDAFHAWMEQNDGNTQNGRPYSISANLKYYPRISFSILPSMSGRYPWSVNLLLSWDWHKQRDWNEARASRELLDAGNLNIISLNPPSGLAYNRKDEYGQSANFTQNSPTTAEKPIEKLRNLNDGVLAVTNSHIQPTFATTVNNWRRLGSIIGFVIFLLVARFIFTLLRKD